MLAQLLGKVTELINGIVDELVSYLYSILLPASSILAIGRPNIFLGSNSVEPSA